MRYIDPTILRNMATVKLFEFDDDIEILKYNKADIRSPVIYSGVSYDKVWRRNEQGEIVWDWKYSGE